MIEDKEPVAFAIRKPSIATPGAFLLFVHRPPSAFGGGGTAMFVVDVLVKTVCGDYAGYCEDREVVRFPHDTPYLLVARHLTIPLTMEELVAQQREEQTRWDEASVDVNKIPLAELTGHLDSGNLPDSPGYGQYL